MKPLQDFMLRPWLYLIIITVGIFLKFYRIDYRYFWYDEVSTIMHTSGISPDEYLKEYPLNEVVNISYYHDLLHLNKQNHTVKSQLKGIWGMTNLNPLHYMLLVFWHRIAGDQDVCYRYFNVLIFLFTLPFLYLLSKRLFKTRLAGLISLSMFAVAPFFQYYTVEARYNMLCTFLIICNALALITAIDKKKIKWWILYIISGIACLYASFNLGLLFIGQFFFILFYNRKLVMQLTIAGTCIFLGYLPWFISVMKYIHEINGALAWHSRYGENQNFFTLLIAQVYFTSFSFVTLRDYFAQINVFLNHQLAGDYIQIIVGTITSVLLIYSVFYTFKNAEKRAFYCALFIILPQIVYFLTTDLIRHTGMSLIWRYDILIIIGFMLFLTFLFSNKLLTMQKAFVWISVIFLSLGIFSDFYMSNKYYIGIFNERIANAALLTSCPKPLLISDFKTVHCEGDAAGIMAFTNECKSDNIDILRVTPDIKDITSCFESKKYSDIFVLHASEALINNLKYQQGIEMDSLQMEGFVNEWRVVLKE